MYTLLFGDTSSWSRSSRDTACPYLLCAWRILFAVPWRNQNFLFKYIKNVFTFRYRHWLVRSASSLPDGIVDVGARCGALVLRQNGQFVLLMRHCTCGSFFPILLFWPSSVFLYSSRPTSHFETSLFLCGLELCLVWLTFSSYFCCFFWVWVCMVEVGPCLCPSKKISLSCSFVVNNLALTKI